MIMWLIHIPTKKKPGLKYKFWMENEARKINKETATSESTKEGKIHKDIMGWKDQKKITADKFDNTIGRKQNRIFQNNETISH